MTLIEQVALASYIDPSTNTELWDRMIKYPADKVSVLIANVLNGPDWKRNDGWASVISAAHNRGKTIIGYVRENSDERKDGGSSLFFENFCHLPPINAQPLFRCDNLTEFRYELGISVMHFRARIR